MAHDVFIQFDELSGISGESFDKEHINWIRVVSYSHTLEQPMAGSSSEMGRSGGRAGLGEGRATHGNMILVKDLDRASPKLALCCCDGRLIKKVKLEICDSANSRQKIMEYIMSDVIVRSITAALGTLMEFDRETITREKVALSYGKIEWLYTIRDPGSPEPKGTIHYYWDAAQNRGG
jgi:type VI secretion system secreted protein Hcp